MPWACFFHHPWYYRETCMSNVKKIVALRSVVEDLSDLRDRTWLSTNNRQSLISEGAWAMELCSSTYFDEIIIFIHKVFFRIRCTYLNLEKLSILVTNLLIYYIQCSNVIYRLFVYFIIWLFTSRSCFFSLYS